MIENGTEAVWLIGPQGDVLFATQSTARILGLEAAAVIGTRVSSWIYEEDRARVADETRPLLTTPSLSVVTELRIRDAQGNLRWFECTSTSLLHEPAIGAVISSFRDVTQRKAAAAELVERQRLLDHVQAVAHLGMWTATELEGSARIVWTAECARIFGRTHAPPPTLDELLTMVHPDERAGAVAAYERAAKDGDVWTSEQRIVHPSGEVRWVYARTFVDAANAEVAGGRPRVGGTVLDITDRTRAEHELRASELRYRRIVENTSEGIWMLDASDRTTYLNPRMAEMLGLPVADALGRPLLSFIDESERPTVARQMQRRHQGEKARAEFPLRRSDGSHVWVAMHAEPLRDEAGNYEGAFALLAAITERRRADDARNRLAAMVESSDDAIIGTTRDGIVTSWNRGASSLFGYTADEATGQSVLFIVPSERHGEEKEILARVANGESIRHYETVRRRKDGSFVAVSLAVSAVRDADGNIVGISRIARDITEQRRTDEAARFLASIVETSADMIISRDVDGIIRTWNRGAEDLTGYTAAEAIGKPTSMFYPPEEEERVARGRREAATGLVKDFELRLLRKDGTTVDVAITSSALRGEDGRILGASIVARDLTERRRAAAALRRSEEQLRQAQKMEAIGNLAGGVAHDFNNLLSVVLSYCDLILEDLPENNPLREDVKEIHKAGVRATQLTRQLLAFSRKQILEPVALELNEVIRGIERMLVRVLGEHVSLSIGTLAQDSRVFADRGQLEQVLMNLAVNARDAMPDGGTLSIETTNVRLDGGDGKSAGEYVLLTVTDSGIGMDESTRERIFEPFFTTKERGKGTGLGLATVYGIIEQSGGYIDVVSAPGRGATFLIHLPRTGRAIATDAMPSSASAKDRGTETVLLVEDEHEVRAIMRTILRKQGYVVLEAQNGGEALLVCEQHGAKIDLLLTDMVMPRMSGRQLADRLRQLRPEMKVLFVSGHTEDALVRGGGSESAFEVLPKPITPSTLARKVRRVLDAGRRPA